MIHSLSGGVIENYDKLIYAFVRVETGVQEIKAWYISPFPKIKVGDKVTIPVGTRGGTATGEVLRVEIVTKQTAPYPVNRTREIESII
jgi:hypothetical protein